MVDNNLYDVLGIQQDAAEGDIRKAYVRKIREFPPELHPEEFKKIREAYETLSNPKTRKEYDTMATHGEEINEFLEEGLSLMDGEDYDEAADMFKRILLIEPGLNYVRNYYALALSYQGDEEKEKAIIQFRKLVEQEPENATYYMNLGLTLRDLERYEEALGALKKGYLNDPDHVDLLFGVVDVYVDLKKYQQAKDVIDSAVSRLDRTDFRTFIYLFKLVQVDILSTNYADLIKTFTRLEMLLSHNVEEKPYVAQRFVKLALDLLKYKEFENAYYLSEKAIELDSENEKIRELHEYVAIRKPLYMEYEMLKDDEQVSDYVKRILVLDLFGDEVSEEEFDEYSEEAYDNLSKAAKYLSSEIVASIKRVLVHYPCLYEDRKELFQKALEVGKYYHSVDTQYQQFKNDTSMINGLKRLIAIYLTDNMSEEEKSQYFRDIMEEMSSETMSHAHRSLQRLKRTYPALFELNSSFLDELLAGTAPAQPQTPPPPQQPRPQSNPSRPQSTPRPQSQQQRTTQTSNSGGSSCFVATAAYGTPLTEELDFLRLWRDSVLRKSRSGARFIAFYYQYGPYFAYVVERSEWLKKAVRRFVYVLIPYLDSKYELSEELSSKR